MSLAGATRRLAPAVAEQVRAGMAGLLPAEEPAYPRSRPGSTFLTDLFNGPGERVRWRKYMAEVAPPGSD